MRIANVVGVWMGHPLSTAEDGSRTSHFLDGDAHVARVMYASGSAAGALASGRLPGGSPERSPITYYTSCVRSYGAGFSPASCVRVVSSCLKALLLFKLLRIIPLAVEAVTICDYGQGYHWSSSLAWKIWHQHPSGEICGLSDSQPYWDERRGQSPAPEAARTPSPIRSDPDLDSSHDCQGKECCLYGCAVPTTASHNDYPTPVVPGNHPHSLPQSPGVQQHIPTSSPFPNNDDEFPPAGYPEVPVSPHHPVVAFASETFSPAGTPIALGEALGSTFHERRLDGINVVANELVVDPISTPGGDWCPPTMWMCATPNMPRSLNMGRYSNISHMALTPYYDSQIASNMSYMSHGAQSLSPQLHSSPDPPVSALSLENFSNPFTSDNSHKEQEATSAELSPAIRVSIEASPVLPALPQRGSIGAAVAEKENRCTLCGISFTQS
ncbi:hypothetical protein BJY52DRAFT_1392339 [Lactarius psammicola]|nr:hypothetical protein BJY52DRAFT_1392339 [Lactarius psammicola]